MFRLQSVDKDGMRSYSEIKREVFTTHHSPLNVFPNPANDIVTISYDRIKKIIITDAAGRVVLQKSYNSIRTVQLPLNNLAKGLYMVQVGGDNETESQKLIIE